MSEIPPYIYGVPLHHEAIDPMAMDDLRATTQRLTTHAIGLNRDEFRSVHLGTTRVLADEEHGGDITVTDFQDDGSSEYSDVLTSRHGFDVERAKVKSVVWLHTARSSLSAEATVYLLTDGRAFAYMEERAGQIPELRTDESVACYRFLEKFGLASKWYDFEHKAYAAEQHMGRDSQAFVDGEPFLLNTDIARILNRGLEAFIETVA